MKSEYSFKSVSACGRSSLELTTTDLIQKAAFPLREARQEVISRLRLQVESGTYRMSFRDIADAILKKLEKRANPCSCQTDPITSARTKG